MCGDSPPSPILTSRGATSSAVDAFVCPASRAESCLECRCCAGVAGIRHPSHGARSRAAQRVASCKHVRIGPRSLLLWHSPTGFGATHEGGDASGPCDRSRLVPRLGSLQGFSGSRWSICDPLAGRLGQFPRPVASIRAIPGDCRVARSEAMRCKHGAYDGRAHAAGVKPTHMLCLLDTDPAMQQGRTLTAAISATIEWLAGDECHALDEAPLAATLRRPSRSARLPLAHLRLYF